MGEAYPEQVAVLLELADEGVRLQPSADAAIRACGTLLAPQDTELAVRLGEALRAYGRLHHRLEALEPDPDLAQTAHDLLGQISYHLHMLRDAGDLAFSGRRVPRNDRFRLELAEGLGPHARGLDLLRSALLARSAILR